LGGPQCTGGDLCYNLTGIETYFNDPKTLELYGVPEGRSWATCNMSVNSDFQPDYLINYGALLPPMLADGVRVMIYVGLEVLLLHIVFLSW
jgi:hypothetical protein